MEHITVTEIENGMFRLVPDDGYVLFNKATRERYSEAVTDDLRMWEVVDK
jgi:hypothetical protein